MKFFEYNNIPQYPTRGILERTNPFLDYIFCVSWSESKSNLISIKLDSRHMGLVDTYAIK